MTSSLLVWSKQQLMVSMKQQSALFVSDHWEVNITPKEEKLSFKNHKWGTSLVVQWVRLHVPSAGGAGSIPGLELDPACRN